MYVCMTTKVYKYFISFKYLFFNVFHIPCSRWVVQYLVLLIAHITINNALLFYDAPLSSFWPSGPF